MKTCFVLLAVGLVAVLNSSASDVSKVSPRRAPNHLSTFAPLQVSRTIEVDLRDPAQGDSANAQRWLVDVTLTESGPISLTLHLDGSTGNERYVDRENIPAFKAVLEKALKWEAIARENNVERFNKPIGNIGNDEIVFQYGGAGAPAYLDPLGFNTREAVAFLKVLPQLGEAEAELDQKIAKRDKESALFK
jgi:hypothetical protein